MRRLPGPAGDGLSDGGNSRGSLRFVSGLAENINSIFCADQGLRMKNTCEDLAHVLVVPCGYFLSSAQAVP